MLGGHYLIGCALLLACGAFAAPRLQLDYESPLSLQAIDAPQSDPVFTLIIYDFLIQLQLLILFFFYRSHTA